MCKTWVTFAPWFYIDQSCTYSCLFLKLWLCNEEALAWASLTFGLNPQLGWVEAEHAASCLSSVPIWWRFFSVSNSNMIFWFGLFQCFDGRPTIIQVEFKEPLEHTAWIGSNEPGTPGPVLKLGGHILNPHHVNSPMCYLVSWYEISMNIIPCCRISEGWPRRNG